MNSGPAEVVFSLGTGSGPTTNLQTGVFRYTNGPVKVPGPWTRGRPKGRSSTKRPSKLPQRGEAGLAILPVEFINTSSSSPAIDASSRAKIRKQVMLHQSRRNQGGKIVSTRQRGAEAEETDETERRAVVPALKLTLWQIDGVDPFDSLPIKMEPYMHDLLRYYVDTVWKNFYTIEHIAGYNPIADFWLHLAFRDVALIHVFIGCACAAASGYMTMENATRGLRHLQAAIISINRRLCGPQKSVAEETVAVVAALAMLEKGAGRHDHWKIHMQGLTRLVDHGGGLEALAMKPFVRNKIYRADLYGALDAGQSPYFEGPSPFPAGDADLESSFLSEGFSSVHQAVRLPATLRMCIHQLEDVLHFWSYADPSLPSALASGNDNIMTRAKRPSAVQAARTRHILTGVQYTLLSARARRECRLSEFCRIALILFSMNVVCEPTTSMSIDPQIGKVFRQAFIDLAWPLNDPTLDVDVALAPWKLPLPIDFCLWAVFLAANAMMDGHSATRAWLLTLFAKLASPGYGNVEEWDDLRRRLGRYLWVPSVLDPCLWRVWTETAELRWQQCEVLASY